MARFRALCDLPDKQPWLARATAVRDADGGLAGSHESLQGIAAIIATVILVLLMYFQVVLAVWLPLGQAAWGGEHRVLPAALRQGQCRSRRNPWTGNLDDSGAS